MKKRLWVKFLAMVLIGCTIFTSVMPSYNVRAAEETELGEELGTEGELFWDLSVSDRNVSFGQLIEGDDSYGCCTPVEVTNLSNSGAAVIWSEYDPAGFFDIDAPANNLLDIGESAVFYFYPKSNLSAGNYSGSVVFAIQQDQSKTYTVNVSATVVPEQPIVYDVYVTPSYAEVSKGGNVQFRASQDGYNLKNLGFTWSVKNNNSANTKISGDGYLTVGSDESSTSLQVIAVSKDDNETYNTANVSVKNNYYNVTAHADEGGQVSGGGSVAGGGSIELFASPNNGYDFDGWYENNKKVSSDKKIRIDNINSDRSFTAKFKRRLAYVITSSSPEKAGTTSGDGYYNVGDKVVVKATAKDGYRFVCWKINNQIVSREREYTLYNVNGEYRLTACYEATEFDVKVCVTPDQTGRIDGAGRYKENSKAVLKATPVEGYVFKGWFSDSTLLSNKDTYTIDKVTKDYCLVAVFEKKAAQAFSMTSKAGAGGVIVPAGAYQVVEGVTVSYLITPNDGYKIADVKVDGKSVGAVSSYAFPNVKANHDIAVTFAKKESGKKNDTQTTVVTPTGNSVSDSKEEQEAKTDEEKEQIAEEIEEAKADVEYDQLTGLLQKYNMTPDEAYMHLYDEVGDAMFEEAYRDGTISFVCNNEYAPNTQATATNEFYATPSVPNYWDVLDDCITDEEAVGVLMGKKYALHIDITDMTQLLSTTERTDMFNYAKENGYTVGNVFDITLIKTFDDVVSNVKDLDVEAEFVMQVPAELQAEASEFKILHIHEDGSREILDDLDNDPTTVTFKTKSFSNFAFVYGNGEAGTVTDANTKLNNAKKVVIVIIAVLAAVLLTLALMLILNKRGKGKKHGKRR